MGRGGEGCDRGRACDRCCKRSSVGALPARRVRGIGSVLTGTVDGELWRLNDQLLNLKPADLFWQAGYGGHDGCLTDVVRPSVPSADAFESSSGREEGKTVCVTRQLTEEAVPAV